MSRKTVVFVIAVVALGALALGLSTRPASVAGSWQVDVHHSDVQLVSDATTDFGKTKINMTLGFGRINGSLKFDDQDATKSSVDLHMYPATAMAPIIEEDGNFKAHWLANLANQTLVCFHSKQVVRTADGKLQATGDLTLTRVDRNLEATPNEGYAGPVYGPPIIHRVTQPATFVFDFAGSDGKKGGAINASASTKVFREDFPQLVRAVVGTYWPPLVQDEKCSTPGPSEAYSGSQCTGTFLKAPNLPEMSGKTIGEDYPGPQDFNSVVGERLDIQLHLHLTPAGSEKQMATGD